MFKQDVRVEDICLGNIIMHNYNNYYTNYYEIKKKELYNKTPSYYKLWLKLIYSPCPKNRSTLVVEHHMNTELLVVADNINQIKWIDV